MNLLRYHVYQTPQAGAPFVVAAFMLKQEALQYARTGNHPDGPLEVRDSWEKGAVIA